MTKEQFADLYGTQPDTLAVLKRAKTELEGIFLKALMVNAESRRTLKLIGMIEDWSTLLEAERCAYSDLPSPASYSKPDLP